MNMELIIIIIITFVDNTGIKNTYGLNRSISRKPIKSSKIYVEGSSFKFLLETKSLK